MISIQQDMDLTAFNTLALQSQTTHYCAVTAIEQLPELIQYAKAQQLKVFVLSGGSNLLLPKQFRALTLHMQNLGIEVLEQSDQDILLKVQAGENWHQFVCECNAQGYYGLENLALIPGKVGAAPIQNIGAYGVEVGEFIENIWAYDLESQQQICLKAMDCQFGYRDSLFKRCAGRYIITAVSFRLLKKAQLKLNYADVAQRIGADPTPEKLLETIIHIRQMKLPQPEQYPNVGSFFKNPVLSAKEFSVFIQQHPLAPHYLQPNQDVKVAAGWLIEQAGWKGKRLGDVGMFERQALVLVNYGQATLIDVQNTYHTVQADIFRKFAISLEPEPILLDDMGQTTAHPHF